MRQPVLMTLLLLLAVTQAGMLTFWSFRRRSRQARRRLRSADTHTGRLALVGEIAGSIAHEISQPLSAILTNADAAESLLNQAHPPLEDIRRMLADIRRDDLRANDIVRHLHALLKRRELQTTMIDLNEIAATALSLIQPVARKRLVTVRSSLDTTLPPVHGDSIHLEQVLLNLMINAMDALDTTLDTTNGANAPDNLDVMVSNTATGLPERILDVTTSRYDKYFAVITVADTGPGIAAAYRRQIFESFFSTKQEGMGLGLAIARTIVQAHGGRIWQEGTSAGGAVFKFTVPLQSG